MNITLKKRHQWLMLAATIISICTAQAQYHYGVKQVLGTDNSGYYMAAGPKDIFIANESKDEVKVYTLQSDSTWTYQQTLTPSDKESGDNTYWYYGSALDVGEGYAIIGAQYKTINNHQDGGIYFYRKDINGWWTEDYIVENPSVNYETDTRSYSYYGGKEISINGTTATATHNNGYPRFVHIYKRQAGGSWAITDTITDPEFLGIDCVHPYFKDTVLITMIYNYKDQRVKEYRLQANGDWKNTDTMSTGITDKDTYFGNKLAVDGNTLVIASDYMADTIGENIYTYMGKVYVYEYLNQKWHLTQTLKPEVPASMVSFGSSVDIKNGMIVVGSFDQTNTGTAVTFYRKIAGQWQQVDRFTQAGYTAENVFINGYQVLVGTSSGSFVLENLKDCNQVPGGFAELNDCNVCYGGTTGIDFETAQGMCVTAIDGQQTQQASVVYPNPFNDHLQVHVTPDTKISLVNTYGRVIFESVGEEKWNTSELSSGIYFLIVDAGSNRNVYKLIKK